MMQHTQAYYKELLSGFIRNTLSPDQVRELYQFIAREPEIYEQLMADPELIALTGQEADLLPVELQAVADQRISDQLQEYAHGHRRGENGTHELTMKSAEAETGRPGTGKVRPMSRRWVWAAAVALLVTGGIAMLLLYSGRRNSPSHPDLVRHAPPSDVPAPRNNRATITLADGHQVALDSLNQGVLAQQGNVRLVKLEDGRIAYQTASGERTQGEGQHAGGDGKENKGGLGIAYNTLSNPRGSRVIDMALGDGSHVWLNAGSSLVYPVAFTGKDRRITVAGEAYFEIAKDAAKPFFVRNGKMEVQVLGTRFNVQAYEEEDAVKVTLLQGLVRVANGVVGTPASVLLQPGQQAAVSDSVRVNYHPDLEAVMAWKDGLFNFNKVPLKEVLRQLARWYDVEVVYQGPVSTQTLGGEMQRDLRLSEVLDGLRDIGIHFRIEGKKLIVMP